MKKINVQKILDNIIAKVFFRFIPHSLKPNFFSYARLVMAPFVYLLLHTNHIYSATILLFVAICTDFIDGALARKRDQITELGKILDPVADKTLILAVLIFIGFKYWIVWVFTIFIILEMVAVVSGALLSKYLGRPLGASVFGKIKMILQSVSVMLFILGFLMLNEDIIIFSENVLILAFAFAIIAGLDVARRKLIYLKKNTSLKDLP
ncbi:MAG: CDP-alcohol phosphatidyltransferase family protein [bacterium]